MVQNKAVRTKDIPALAHPQVSAKLALNGLLLVKMSAAIARTSLVTNFDPTFSRTTFICLASDGFACKS